MLNFVVADGVEPPQSKRLVYSQVGSPRAQCYLNDGCATFTPLDPIKDPLGLEPKPSISYTYPDSNGDYEIRSLACCPFHYRCIEPLV